MTANQKPKLKPSPVSVKRFKNSLQKIFFMARGWSFQDTVRALKPKINGYAAYFCLTETKATWEELDQWLRHKMRCLIWQRWKKPKTRYKNLIRWGIDPEMARKAAGNGRGAWWNSRQQPPISDAQSLSKCVAKKTRTSVASRNNGMPQSQESLV